MELNQAFTSPMVLRMKSYTLGTASRGTDIYTVIQKGANDWRGDERIERENMEKENYYLRKQKTMLESYEGHAPKTNTSIDGRPFGTMKIFSGRKGEKTLCQ